MSETIYGSQQDLTSSLISLKTNNLLFNTMTNGLVEINESTIINVSSTPINQSDSVSKQYVDQYILDNPPVLPGGSDKQLQYNDGFGNFAGTTNFTWTTATNTLTSTGTLSNGTALWSGNVIRNLVEPTISSDLVTKSYVDKLYTITEHTIDINENTTYTVEQCTNSFINRVGHAGTTLIDLTPSAEDFINYLSNAGTGTTAFFSIKNTSDSYDALIIIVPNIGIVIPDIGVPGTSTIKRQLFVTLRKDQVLNFKIYIVSTVSGNEIVYMTIESISFMKFALDQESNWITKFNFQVNSNNLLFTYYDSLLSIDYFLDRKVPTTILNDSNMIYSSQMLLNKIIIRGPGLTANRTDKFESSVILNQLAPIFFTYPANGLQGSFTYRCGFTIYILNEDSTYSIILDIANSSGWIDIDSTGIKTIGPGQTGIFGLSFFSKNVSSSVDTAYVYTIGICDR
jgi:hypothetical protein